MWLLALSAPGVPGTRGARSGANNAPLIGSSRDLSNVERAGILLGKSEMLTTFTWLKKPATTNRSKDVYLKIRFHITG